MAHNFAKAFNGMDERAKRIEALKAEVLNLQEEVGTLEEINQKTRNSLCHSTEDLDKTKERLRRFEDGFYNKKRALERSREVASSLGETTEFLRMENNDLKNSLAIKEQELKGLQASSSWFRSISEAAQLRSFDHWIRFVQAEAHCSTLQESRSSLLGRVARLETALQDCRTMNHRYRSRLAYVRSRAQKLGNIKQSVQKFLRLTEKGVYSSSVRSLIVRLRTLGLGGKNAGFALDAFLEVISGLLGDKQQKKKRRVVSARSAGRMATEAGVMSLVQLGFQLKQSKSFTTGGDGTSHKNQNYEALNANITTRGSEGNENGEIDHKVLYVKVERTLNHRAETQKNTLVDGLKEAVDTFNRSPLGNACNTPGNVLSEEEQELLTEPARKAMIERQGGLDAWNQLDEEVRALQEVELLSNVCESLYNEALERLSPSEQHHLKIWVWAGCAMHKDLNAVKGGDAAMRAKWEELGELPVSLPNKDNAAVMEGMRGEEELDEDDELEPDMDPFNASADASTSAAMLQSHQKNVRGRTSMQQHHLQNSRSAGRNGAAEVVKRAQDVTQGGAVKTFRLMGAYYRNKDDKKGQHDSFRDYSIFNLERTFTFPNTSSTRYSSYLEAAAEVITNRCMYITYMERVRALRENSRRNNLETNILRALNDVPTLTEIAVLALYREAVSISYIKAVRGKRMNALEMRPLHEKLKTHIQMLIDDPKIMLGQDADPQKATLGGNKEWRSPDCAFVRREARRIEASGEEKKRRREMDKEKEEIARKKVRKEEAKKEKRDEEERRLAAIPIERDPARLIVMTVSQLNDQLKKLQRAYGNVPAISSLRKKENKLSAVLKALVQKDLCRVDEIPPPYDRFLVEISPAGESSADCGIDEKCGNQVTYQRQTSYLEDNPQGYIV
ncbi:hypothetical protein ACEPAI_3237 [Sanghuangporus weigelae]